MPNVVTLTLPALPRAPETIMIVSNAVPQLAKLVVSHRKDGAKLVDHLVSMSYLFPSLDSLEISCHTSEFSQELEDQLRRNVEVLEGKPNLEFKVFV